jgi:carbonic anhydrase/acetyltransferase-like protein (isoleucine patch superfamily)
MTIRPFQDKQPLIAENVYVDPTALVIGDVEIGADSSIWPMTVVRGDVNFIRIGALTNIQDACVLHVAHAGPFNTTGFPLIIGDKVTVGHQATLHACTIEDLCLIGIGARIMDGAHIESYTVIGAGALVPPGKRLESGYLWLGQPAKAVRPLTEKEKEHLQYSAEYYAKLKNKYF